MEAATPLQGGDLRREVERRAQIPLKLASLLESERRPEEQRDAWVAERLTAQLEAARQSPFWRERLPAGAGLRDVPPLSRAELASSFDALRAPAAAPVVERRTSGSSGVPVSVLHGAATVGFAAAARLRQLAWFGLEPRDHPQLNMRIASSAADPPLRREPREPALWWLNPYRLDARTVHQVHAELLEAGGVRLAGAESSLMAQWAGLYEAGGLDGRELDLRLAVVGGEMTYPRQRAAAEAAFGCPVAEMYGSHELGIVATECPEGSLHVASEAVLVEVVGQDGEPLPPGEHGEVLVTLLHNSEFPLLRYRLGDSVAWLPHPCPCGRTLPALKIEVGRLEEMVRAPDGRLLHPRFLRSVYERCLGEGLRSFHTLQVGPAEFIVRVEAHELPADAEELLAGEIAAYLGEPVTVRVERNPRAVAPEGKLRTFTRAV